jgi:prepilin-type N-terminal cleavage/methylation domain-containing protein
MRRADGGASHRQSPQRTGGFSLVEVVIGMAVLGLAFHRTNQVVGPIERIVRELDERLSGEKNGPITLRPGDQLIPLADKINALLQERDQFKNPPAQESRAAAAAA